MTFEERNQKLYCSEVVWKFINRVQTLRLENFLIVQQKIKKRYGDTIPINEIVINPQSMYESPLLELIVENQ